MYITWVFKEAFLQVRTHACVVYQITAKSVQHESSLAQLTNDREAGARHPYKHGFSN